MVFQGEVLPVTEMIRLAEEGPDAPVNSAGVLHTAAGNALDAAELVSDGQPPTAGWRFGVLQTLDDYTSTCRRGGAELGSGVFTDPPAPTGSVELDAAFAALAEYLAERDGWTPPAWTSDAWRSVAPAVWWASTPSIHREIALEESPRPFRKRGIWITLSGLARA
ncbi:hypothetical protein GW571_14760 (plasmid) [Clavibacter capsici]|uniref:Uncharacterized protein n=3 Tax=Clavibacter capsici TaxID=1874630 RepID=A0A0M5JPE0_9MICO|nr:hypothetical protein AES38_15250 [Clavibacter capsici]QIS40601.1 hypothetical protein GW572_15460 [Clavibacter capsici]QIS43583.1 hypothetical protein GW571_14760 [Clavibacter capsici]QIS46525.1 hypothetical protein GW570_14790 [Clavibacter capsici]